MNSHYRPFPARGVTGELAPAALVTASYAPDFERCALLCETVDRHVTGFRRHYILVAARDVALFRALEGSNREVVDERELLPSWLHAVRDPLATFRRQLWLSWRVPPLRGWHVQQLRRIALASVIPEPVMVFCDSDVAFVRPFDCGNFVVGDECALFRRDRALVDPELEEQRVWSANAANDLGIAEESVSLHDYVGTLIAWRRETVMAMTSHIENAHGRDWVEVVASHRRFSECMLYGRYVDDVIEGRGHFHQSEPYCHVYWKGPRLTAAHFDEFVDGMRPDQVAIGIQSFTGTDTADLRRWLMKS